ncbi:MAG: tryptophan synthase subunit alpha [Chloroflexi bacterium]|nr:tryptophan synthase subunit alpha [Chloroflexota bacterium]
MSNSSRIVTCFARLKAARRTGVITYLTVGYPTLAETPALGSALIQGGSCLIELGVPFSDPLADGATIQRANTAALQQGVGLAACLEVARWLRQEWRDVPLVLMGYYNTFLSYGLERFCADAAAVGVDGAIVVDLPPEESGPLLQHAGPAGLAVIPLLAPTSTEERIRRVATQASGFIYCVSVAGITGARDRLPEHLPPFLARVRTHTGLPLAVGFGLSRPEHVAAVGQWAEAAVIGSAIIDTIDRSLPQERVAALRSYVSALCGHPLSRHSK